MTLSDRGISIEKWLSFVQQLIDEDIIAYITNIKNVKRLLYSNSYIELHNNVNEHFNTDRYVDPSNEYVAAVDI